MADCKMCDEKAVAQGLCRACYNQEYSAGRLEKVSPAGRKKATVTTLPPEDTYVPSTEELVNKAKRLANEILDNPNASQAERNNVLRILLSGKEKGGMTPDMKQKFNEMVGRVNDE